MSSIKPAIIICDEPIIHKPKPKRTHKIQNNMPYHYNNGPSNNRRLNHEKNYRKNNNYESKNNKIKNKTSDKLSFNLDLISLEEMENDFNEFKSKSEEIEVQRELLNLLRNANNNYNKNELKNRKFGKYKRPENPACKNYELFI